jgi:hypothetical protein
MSMVAPAPWAALLVLCAYTHDFDCSTTATKFEKGIAAICIGGGEAVAIAVEVV